MTPPPSLTKYYNDRIKLAADLFEQLLDEKDPKQALTDFISTDPEFNLEYLCKTREPDDTETLLNVLKTSHILEKENILNQVDGKEINAFVDSLTPKNFYKFSQIPGAFNLLRKTNYSPHAFKHKLENCLDELDFENSDNPTKDTETIKLTEIARITSPTDMTLQFPNEGGGLFHLYELK